MKEGALGRVYKADVEVADVSPRLDRLRKLVVVLVVVIVAAGNVPRLVVERDCNPRESLVHQREHLGEPGVETSVFRESTDLLQELIG